MYSFSLLKDFSSPPPLSRHLWKTRGQWQGARTFRPLAYPLLFYSTLDIFKTFVSCTLYSITKCNLHVLWALTCKIQVCLISLLHLYSRTFSFFPFNYVFKIFISQTFCFHFFVTFSFSFATFCFHFFLNNISLQFFSTILRFCFAHFVSIFYNSLA